MDTGGSERQVIELVRAASRRQVACSIICLSHEGPLAAEAREAGVPVTAINLNRPWKLWRLWALAGALRETRPDAVYALLFWGYGLGLPTAAVATPRAVRVAGRRSLPREDRPRHTAWLPLRRVADRCSHAIVTNSHAGAAAWLRAAPRLAGRLHVVANGARIPARPSAPPPAPPIDMVCVANLTQYKAHDVLLDALAALPADAPDWRMTLIGEGPDRAALMAQRERLCLTSHVNFAGRRSDVDRYLERSHLAVLASRTEGMPNAVLEAMAHGVPVVATNVGGIPELLASGAGRTVPPDDPPRLAAALLELLRDPAARRTAGAEGRRLATEVYSIAAMCDATLAIMRRLVDERGDGERAARRLERKRAGTHREGARDQAGEAERERQRADHGDRLMRRDGDSARGGGEQQ